MPRRQQRSPNWRGQSQLRNRYVTQPIPATFTAQTSDTVTLLCDGNFPPPIAIGIPQMRRDPAGDYPVSITVSGYSIILGWAAPVSLPQVFTLPAGDPNVRTSTGGFLPPMTVFVDAVPYPFPGDPTTGWQQNSYAANLFYCDVLAPIGWFNPAARFTISSTGGPCAVNQTGANQFSLDWGVTVNSGDTITFPLECLDIICWTGATASILEGKSLIVS